VTITARVHNRSIALPPEVEVAEGQNVVVILPERPMAEAVEMARFDVWLAASVGLAGGRFTTTERMRETRGEE